MKHLWWAAPTIITAAALLWCERWPLAHGPLAPVKRVAMQLGALLICAIVWCIGAIIK